MERLAFTVDEAAALLGWSRDGIYDAIAAGHLARIPHTGRRVLVARIELERFAAKGIHNDPDVVVAVTGLGPHTRTAPVTASRTAGLAAPFRNGEGAPAHTGTNPAKGPRPAA